MQNPLSNLLSTSNIALADVVWLSFYIATFLFTLHAIIVAYHWLTFGTSRSLSVTAVSIYVGAGALILLTVATTISLTM